MNNDSGNAKDNNRQFEDKPKTVKKFVLADAHGIESYIPFDENNASPIAALILRAQFNRQRHAITFAVILSPDVDEVITDTMIKKKDFKTALTILKERSIKIQFAPDNYARLYKQSYDMIPNDKLDPWY